MTFADLQGKRALITGAARGIGEAVARGMARQGASVVVADIRAEHLEDVAASIRADGHEASAVGVDLRDVGAVERLVGQAVDRYGGIDILHNNAAIVGPHGDFFAYTASEWDEIVQVNLRSAFFLCQGAARVMIEQGSGGRILNTTSTSAFVASPRSIVPYDVTKAGLRQLTVSLANVLAPHAITVNAIAPGAIATYFGTDDSAPSKGDPATEPWRNERARSMIPLGRVGTPEDVVGAAIFLSSDEAAYITGHTLVVDGGVLVR